MSMTLKPERDAATRDKKTQEIRLRISVIVEPDDEGFHAYCPAFKGLHVDGTTQKDAMANATRAVRVYVESLVAHGEPLPIGPHCIREEHLPEISPDALLQFVDLQWPTHEMSGIS
jgi:predicted RNase H-like HicB family nuclease